jgi:hypothetical protein
MRLALPVEDWAPPFKTGFARSKAKAMDPEIARNQHYDDHYANDSEDVHSALLPFMMIDRWLGATEASKYKPFLSPPPISPIAAPSEEQKEHEDNENEIHIFLQNVWREIFPPAHVGAE